jgi:hypothetical protein
MTIDELIAKLGELPGDWEVVATKAGSSLEVWEPTEAIEYGYVFTDERPIKLFIDRRRRRRRMEVKPKAKPRKKK